MFRTDERDNLSSELNETKLKLDKMTTELAQVQQQYQEASLLESQLSQAKEETAKYRNLFEARFF